MFRYYPNSKLCYGKTEKLKNHEEKLMKVAYARVSTGVQNLDLQLDALREHGCEEIFTDKIRGAKDKRQGLEEALRFVRSGDTIVVWRLDRLDRNMQHLIKNCE
jgi:DNA invertase Pin-like site-specific DNA recombinase